MQDIIGFLDAWIKKWSWRAFAWHSNFFYHFTSIVENSISFVSFWLHYVHWWNWFQYVVLHNFFVHCVERNQIVWNGCILHQVMLVWTVKNIYWENPLIKLLILWLRMMRRYWLRLFPLIISLLHAHKKVIIFLFWIECWCPRSKLHGRRQF